MRTGYIRIDVSECIHEIEDDDLLLELKHRKLLDQNEQPISFGEVERVYNYLQVGDTEEALLILERLVRPKWGCVADAEDALKEARAA